MNTKNQLTHSLAKIKKFLKNPSEERLDMIRKIAFDAISRNDVACDFCEHDDFGRCLLHDVPEYEMNVKYCLPAFVKLLEHKLEKAV